MAELGQQQTLPQDGKSFLCPRTARPSSVPEVAERRTGSVPDSAKQTCLVRDIAHQTSQNQTAYRADLPRT